MAIVAQVVILLMLAGFAMAVVGAIFTWLVRLMIRLMTAAGVALFAVMVAVGLGLEEWATAMLTLAAFVLTFSIFGRRERPNSAPPVSPILPSVRWMRQHRAVAKAWRHIADHCPEVAVELRPAERACATLLRAASRDPEAMGIDLDLIELATFIRRHVPELAAAVSEMGEIGRPHQSKPTRDLAQNLMLLGRRAQAILGRARLSNAESFRLRSDHLNLRLQAFEAADRRNESIGIQ